MPCVFLFGNNNRQRPHRSGTRGIIRSAFIRNQRLAADLSDHPGVEIIGMVHIVAADIGEALAPQQRIVEAGNLGHSHALSLQLEQHRLVFSLLAVGEEHLGINSAFGLVLRVMSMMPFI